MTTPSGTSSLGSCAIASCRFGSNFCPSASIGCRPLSAENPSVVSRPCSSRNRSATSRLRSRAAERPSSKLSRIGDKPLEERAVGVFDRLFFLARGAFLEILEVGLAAQGQIAKAIEIGLQAGVGSSSSRRPSVSAPASDLDRRRRFASGLRGVQLLDFSHVLRMAIKVMSSFCGCAPDEIARHHRSAA